MNHIGLFAKFWQPGTVKTRLAAKIGNESACEIYRDFVFHLLARLNAIGDTRTVVFSPPEKQTEFENSIPDPWGLVPQSPGDLGQRMGTFFKSTFDDSNIQNLDSPTKVVVIGADSPHIEANQIQSAFDALENNSVVLGPSTDGGYYLVGMNKPCLEIFDGIQWSTESVLQRTIKILKDRQLSFELLEPMTDVDELNDLVDLQSVLTQLPAPDHLDTKLMRKIQTILRQHQTSELSPGESA